MQEACSPRRSTAAFRPELSTQGTTGSDSLVLLFRMAKLKELNDFRQSVEAEFGTDGVLPGPKLAWGTRDWMGGKPLGNGQGGWLHSLRISAHHPNGNEPSRPQVVELPSRTQVWGGRRGRTNELMSMASGFSPSPATLSTIPGVTGIFRWQRFGSFA